MVVEIPLRSSIFYKYFHIFNYIFLFILLIHHQRVRNIDLIIVGVGVVVVKSEHT